MSHDSTVPNGAVSNKKEDQNSHGQELQNVNALNHSFVRDGRYSFNICGQKYEVLCTTLQRHPNTLLANETKMVKYWDEKRQEYFLDRNRTCFEAVLAYYQSGKGTLTRPHSVPESLFLNEIEFYDLGEEVLKKFRDNDVQQESEQTSKKRPMPRCLFQRRVWKLFEYPETSNGARFVAWLNCAVVLLSIVTFCVETLPEFHHGTAENKGVFFAVEAACIAWFTVEYFIRLLSSPNKWNFVTEMMNIIDLVAIMPFFVSFTLSSNESNVSFLAIIRIVRLVRVFRIFKLSRYSTGLQILGMSLRASLTELGLLVFFLSVGVVLFSSAIYCAERNVKDTEFKSIPHSFWWAIITMTTVGYGDMYPTTVWGKLIGSVCACTGILAIALPVPVIVANFERFYSKAQLQAKENSKEKRDKSEEYPALKRLFDRLKRRSRSRPGRNTSYRSSSFRGGTRRDDKYCKANATRKDKVNSFEIDQHSSLVKENGKQLHITEV